MQPVEIAQRLLAEHALQRRFEPFAAETGLRTLEMAYDVQDALVELWGEQRDASAIGYKIGLTSKRMQAMCGIDHPIAGVILSDRVLASGAWLDPAGYGRLGVEFEIAIRLSRDVAGSGRTSAAEIAAAISAVAPAIEIVDDRMADYQALDLLSLVADNSWNAGIILGAWTSTWPDLASIAGTVTCNGAALDHGVGGDVLGHPFTPVAWLAEHLAARETLLAAGTIILTGSIVTTKFPKGGETYRFELAQLGAVDVSVG
jgi:2-keto-4-pentenoate hydratase